MNRLVISRYFPAAHWLIWKGDHSRQQLLKMGFIPYFTFNRAAEMTQSSQSGSRRGPIRQSHASLESRNVICAHLDRNDQKSRRFLQYISAETHRVITLVRDAKTGRILKTPPSEHLWLYGQSLVMGELPRPSGRSVLRLGPNSSNRSKSLGSGILVSRNTTMCIFGISCLESTTRTSTTPYSCC